MPREGMPGFRADTGDSEPFLGIAQMPGGIAEKEWKKKEKRDGKELVFLVYFIWPVTSSVWTPFFITWKANFSCNIKTKNMELHQSVV